MSILEVDSTEPKFIVVWFIIDWFLYLGDITLLILAFIKEKLVLVSKSILYAILLTLAIAGFCVILKLDPPKVLPNFPFGLSMLFDYALILSFN